MEALGSQGVCTQYKKILCEPYKNFITEISPFYNVVNIYMKGGVRQGYTISPKLVTATLQNVILGLEWDSMGVKIDADDIVLITPDISQAERMFADFDKACGKIGLRLNLKKTMFMKNGLVSFAPSTLNGTNISKCSSYVYLESCTRKPHLVPLSTLKRDEIGHSILHCKETLPRGSPRTSHDLLTTGVFAAKILSLSSSAAGAVMVPLISSYLWETATERPTIMLFTIVANTFLALLSFTPLLLHFLTKRFPINLYYNKDTKIFTSVHYNFFLKKMALQFKAGEVVDAQIAPEMKKSLLDCITQYSACSRFCEFLLISPPDNMERDIDGGHVNNVPYISGQLYLQLLIFFEIFKVWIPLATAFVHSKPLLISLDRNAYVDKLAFDEITKNINIPSNHD
uniref:Reverse transcriptase domain-containing protein n=1 Tax=Angiostrongylus cantonensis TaxID=6313 RepID=A0A0K0DBS9_ANGCA